MNYSEALEFIHSMRRFGKKAGLEKISRLMAALGSPQERLSIVHVAGTNGKGSTTAMLASVLSSAGYKTGMFISPFVLDFRERFQVDGQFIPQEELAEVTAVVRAKITELFEPGDYPAEFEVVTAIAFVWFAQCGCDYVVLEVGLGGRFDATNIIPTPLVSVITSVSFDHMDILGDTLTKIAFEKCGIIKPGGVTVCYDDQPPEALAEIQKNAAERGNRLVVGEYSLVCGLSTGSAGSCFSYRGTDILLPLVGPHQVHNCITVLETLFELRRQGVYVPDKSITEGIAAVRFPARMETLHSHPPVLLDGAHNASGIESLVAGLNAALRDAPVVAVIGMMADKDMDDALRMLCGRVRQFVTVTPSYAARALPADALALKLCALGATAEPATGFEDALVMALDLAGPHGAVVICGSLYLASDMRPVVLDYFKNHEGGV